MGGMSTVRAFSIGICNDGARSRIAAIMDLSWLPEDKILVRDLCRVRMATRVCRLGCHSRLSMNVVHFGVHPMLSVRIEGSSVVLTSIQRPKGRGNSDIGACHGICCRTPWILASD